MSIKTLNPRHLSHRIKVERDLFRKVIHIGLSEFWLRLGVEIGVCATGVCGFGLPISGDEFRERRAGVFESLEVVFLVVGDTIFPAAEDDAEPFVGKRSSCDLR